MTRSGCPCPSSSPQRVGLETPCRPHTGHPQGHLHDVVVRYCDPILAKTSCCVPLVDSQSTRSPRCFSEYVVLLAAASTGSPARPALPVHQPVLRATWQGAFAAQPLARLTLSVRERAAWLRAGQFQSWRGDRIYCSHCARCRGSICEGPELLKSGQALRPWRVPVG